MVTRSEKERGPKISLIMIFGCAKILNIFGIVKN